MGSFNIGEVGGGGMGYNPCASVSACLQHGHFDSLQPPQLFEVKVIITIIITKVIVIVINNNSITVDGGNLAPLRAPRLTYFLGI